MPTILNPRDTEHRNPGLEDNGNGRRPPIDKHTGGGGSGDNDNYRSPRGPRERLIRYRMGIFSALAGDMLFFAGLVVVFTGTRLGSSVDMHTGQITRSAWHTITLPHILWWNTLVLIISSITMELARHSMFREIDVMEEWLGLGTPTSSHARPWLFATTVLGLLFLAGQWRAWYLLSLQPALIRANPSARFFYVITGIHAAHLFLGIAALIAASIALYRSRQLESRQIFVDCVSWYWHSMGIFWIFLFILLRFCQ